MTAPRDDRLPKGIAPEHLDFIAHERRKGSTWEEISLTVGVSGKTLSSWWAKRGPYGPEADLMWVCFQDAGGECWTWCNRDICIQPNATLGRFMPPS